MGDLAEVDGEPVTLRKSVFVKVIVTGFQSSGSSSPEAVSSFEIIDVATGKTTIYQSFGNLIFRPVVGDFNG